MYTYIDMEGYTICTYIEMYAPGIHDFCPKDHFVHLSHVFSVKNLWTRPDSMTHTLCRLQSR